MRTMETRHGDKSQRPTTAAKFCAEDAEAYGVGTEVGEVTEARRFDFGAGLRESQSNTNAKLIVLSDRINKICRIERDKESGL